MQEAIPGLVSREIRSHLSLFSSRDARVHELVNCAEASRASQEETNLLSHGEGPLVTIANVQGDKSGKTFAQWQQSAMRKGGLLYQ